MDIRSVITELIRKECEAFKLVELGLLPSVEAGVELVILVSDKTDLLVFSDFSRFQAWRGGLLRLFYAEIDYTGFISREGKGTAFRRFVSDLKKRMVGRQRLEYGKETIDRVLAVSPHTLAFRLSAMLDEEMFAEEWDDIRASFQPSGLDEICRRSCRNRFPIGLDDLFIRLRKDDPEFWNTLCLTIKKLTDLVLSGQYVSVQYRKEVVQDTWSDVSVFLRQKVAGEGLPEFETPLHFRNYLARVCQNKMREAIRRNCSLEILADIQEELQDVFFSMPEEERDMPFRLEELDAEDYESVGRALTVILWDKVEPWYSRLVSGIEEKVGLLFLHYADGLPYDRIASIRGNGLSGVELKRLENKLRQDAVRARRLLRERFMDLLNNGI